MLYFFRSFILSAILFFLNAIFLVTKSFEKNPVVIFLYGGGGVSPIKLHFSPAALQGFYEMK